MTLRPNSSFSPDRVISGGRIAAVDRPEGVAKSVGRSSCKDGLGGVFVLGASGAGVLGGVADRGGIEFERLRSGGGFLRGQGGGFLADRRRRALSRWRYFGRWRACTGGSRGEVRGRGGWRHAWWARQCRDGGDGRRRRCGSVPGIGTALMRARRLCTAGQLGRIDQFDADGIGVSIPFAKLARGRPADAQDHARMQQGGTRQANPECVPRHVPRIRERLALQLHTALLPPRPQPTKGSPASRYLTAWTTRREKGRSGAIGSVHRDGRWPCRAQPPGQVSPAGFPGPLSAKL